jgi:UDP-2-acetamido-2,6-beta-L-arabino-hexul-4-ose reductase
LIRNVFMTGASGLLGQTVTTRVAQIEGLNTFPLGRSSTDTQWRHAVSSSDAGLHLAGVTRPQHPDEFWSGNVGTTEAVIAAVRRLDRSLPLLYASSIRANEPTLYGQTKKAAEDLLLDWARDTGSPVTILRLPSFFGAWSRPGYNSAVATFCHDVAHGMTPEIRTPEASISLVHLDDVVDAIISWMEAPALESGFRDVTPTHISTVGHVASIIASFGSDANLRTSEEEAGLVRGLWQTYRSHQNHIGGPLIPPSIPSKQET